MSEHAVRFGDENALSGILTEATAPSTGTGVAILSAGITHRVGPNRLHVSLARDLAARGFANLRFDLSGVGESETATDQDSYEVRTDREVGQALDLLRARGAAERFLLLGLCSGADNAFRASLRDPRVAGAVLIEGYAFSSRAYRLDYYSRRLIRIETWRRLVHGRIKFKDVVTGLGGIRPRRTVPRDEPDHAERFFKMPPADRIVADLRELAGRGTELLFVMSRDSPSEYNFRSIIRPEIRQGPFQARVEVKAFRDIDHTFSRVGLRAELVELVGDWAARHFPRSGPPPR